MGALHTLDYVVLAVYFAIVIAVCARVSRRSPDSDELFLAGRTLAWIQDNLELDDVRATVAEWNGPDVPAEDWTYTRRTLAERCWVGLRGQGGR